MIRRREFIALLGGAVAWPLAARAQQPPMPVIGFLGGGSSDSLLRPIAAFSQALKEVGYLERQNVAIEYRWADGDYDRLPVLAADLVQRNVRVILGSGNAAAHTAWTVSQTTPIVFVTGDDPVATGLVPGINRPGGNLTGITMMAGSLQMKRLQLLHELIPAITTFAFLVNSANANAEGDTRAVETAARILGLALIAVKTPGQGDLDAVFETIAQKAVKGIVVNTDSAFLSRRKQIAILAARHRIAGIYSLRDFVEDGGLISYGADIADAYRQAGLYVARILRGEKPSELPVMQPAKFELVINLKAAKALGFNVSPNFLVLADEVIE